METVRAALALVLISFAPGCTVIDDAQYDDRAGELEALRTEFLPGSARVSEISATGSRLYWLDLEGAFDTPRLHSFEPATGDRVDYPIEDTESDFASEYHTSDQLVVRCGFSTAEAYSAGTGKLLDTLSDDVNHCAVDGGDVYYLKAGQVLRWRPLQGAPVAVIELDPMISISSSAFAVEGNRGVLAEGGRVWNLDLQARTATWLENEDQASGLVAFDDRSVVFETFDGAFEIDFATHAARSIDDLIADGGYHLNASHDDIQDMAGTLEFTIYDRHLIYRGRRGIFALGLDTGKVTDLLLDRGEEFDPTPRYRSPSVTSGGALFVHDLNDDGPSSHPVYRVELAGRLTAARP